MFLVVGVSMIIDLVCRVWLKLLRVCVWRTCLYECVCVCVSVCFLTIIRFSLSTKSTSGSRHHPLSGISHSVG